ncbi:hypothetical protein LEP1GSC060_1469 [Leptospira weilii serovar Ranarum str. ICFT]|uniref:Uncharacterized protein n=1 Tax=Leptospira weilii serovar Ranarum str. ICFT TaxID=1218598 RepID=N1WKC8_9LEPT|nr:hypothetical protein [Leptospira weilii]EMY76273.1 hypothetical protein LEP1GSC060_1469 [Leptospira weilii serovar Ranarum str. ICFT]
MFGLKISTNRNTESFFSDLLLAFNRVGVFFWICFLTPILSLQSNSRAPRAVNAAPGSVLFSKSKEVRLEEEKLFIHCENLCSIKAVYRIHSEQKGRYLFYFVLPASATLEILHNRNGISSVSKAEKSIKELSPYLKELADSMKEQKKYPEHKVYDTPHVAEFQLNLEKGIQEVEIGYVMRPGQNETGFGYLSFGDPDFWGVIEYDLWPAKEWISKNFRLTFEMSLPENRRFFFWGRRNLTCFDLGKNDYKTKELNPEHSSARSDKRVFRFQFGSEFPDILRCTYDLDGPLYR